MVLRVTALVVAFTLAGCERPAPPVPSGPPQFVVGQGYQSQGEWIYPQNFSAYDKTGLSEVVLDGHPPFVADGEVYDPDAIAAASPVLQLPAIATVTNLENGYSMDVRVNDRGPDNPGRIIAVTPKVASLLGFPQDGVTEVEVVLKPRETAQLDATLGQGPKMTAAPVASITEQSLGPPGGMAGGPAGQGGEAAVQTISGDGHEQNADQGGGAPDPVTLSGEVTVYPPSPGPLFVQIPGFGRPRDADATLEALAGLPTEVVPTADGERVLYAIRIGPYEDVASADAALRACLQRGVTDPEIIVR